MQDPRQDQDLGTASGSDCLQVGDRRVQLSRPVVCQLFPINLDQLDWTCGEKEGFSEDGYETKARLGK